jgi:hypothetical protein
MPRNSYYCVERKTVSYQRVFIPNSGMIYQKGQRQSGDLDGPESPTDSQEGKELWLTTWNF